MKIFTWKIATPRRREGLLRRRGQPRRRQLRLGEPGDNEGGHLYIPRLSVAFLGEPLCLSADRLRISVARWFEACFCSLFRVGLVARFVIIVVCFWGHCLTCLDVNVCVLTC